MTWELIFGCVAEVAIVPPFCRSFVATCDPLPGRSLCVCTPIRSPAIGEVNLVPGYKSRPK